MKRCFVMMALVFLTISGMKTEVMAQDQVSMSISMYKNFSSAGETYGISFDLSNDALKKVTSVSIKGPKAPKIVANNPLDLNDMALSAVNLSLADFNRWFPEGNYKISTIPARFGILSVPVTHNFPSTPAVLYPLEGSSDVPTNPVITWTSVTGIIGLRLQLKNDDIDFVYSTGLPVNATSFAVPANVLKPNTRYELSLQAKGTDVSGNGLSTTMTLSFITMAQ